MRRLPMAAAVVAVLAAGCGSSGPSLSAFRSGFKTQKTQFTALGHQLSRTVANARGKTNAQLASEFDSLAASTSRVATGLRKLDPPAQYKARMTQLISGFEVVAGDLSSIGSAASRRDSAGVGTAAAKLVQDTASVKSVDRSITGSLGLPQSS